MRKFKRIFFLNILSFFRIRQVHKYVRDIYVAKFPELEQLVLNPLDYVLVVRVIQNETVSNITNKEEEEEEDIFNYAIAVNLFI